MSNQPPFKAGDPVRIYYRGEPCGCGCKARGEVVRVAPMRIAVRSFCAAGGGSFTHDYRRKGERWVRDGHDACEVK